ncbi:MucBP domain-containing protein [Fructilactobacillus ixorae]|uniref:MucBP domain-containing protein n=1 Tax=Fructilactobacillus ixorae TaxID=1750535 RepID=UPI00339008E4
MVVALYQIPRRVVTSPVIKIHYQSDDGEPLEKIDNQLSDVTLTGSPGSSYSIKTPPVSGYGYLKSTLPLKGVFTSSQSALVIYSKNK